MEDTAESESDQVVIVPSKHMSLDKCHGNWTPGEMKILRDVQQNLSVKVPKVRIYREYQKKQYCCRDEAVRVEFTKKILMICWDRKLEAI